jgi:hypothetical protein
VPQPPRRLRPAAPRAALSAFLLALALFVATMPTVEAARAWCRTDPVVLIGGQLADVFVMAPPTAPLKVTGPNQVVITVPTGVPAKLVLKDLGFGRGEVVTFKESDRLRVTEDGIELIVKVYVPARDDAMPVRVEFAPRIVGILRPASAEGTANQWITLKTRF